MFEHFYYEGIRKTVIAFGTLFNNIYIKHKNNQNEIISTQKVSIAYGPTQKFLARLEQSPNLNKPIQVTTPRMSMEILGLKYDPERKANKMRGYVTSGPSGEPYKSYLPVPYDINFELSIFTKLEDDMFQIVEQILPYFQPHYTISIILVEEINEKRDVIFNLDNISLTDNYEGNFEERRALIWTLKFTAKTYLFLPVANDSIASSIINKVTLGFVAGSTGGTNISTDVDIVTTPKATKNYTGIISTRIINDLEIDGTFIKVEQLENLNNKSLIQINNETLYIENIIGNDVKVIRGLFGTKAELHTSGSDILSITSIDNSMIPMNSPFGFNTQII